MVRAYFVHSHINNKHFTAAYGQPMVLLCSVEDTRTWTGLYQSKEIFKCSQGESYRNQY
jgi:hypothetical protein